jgi:hypothetical protein
MTETTAVMSGVNSTWHAPVILQLPGAAPNHLVPWVT